MSQVYTTLGGSSLRTKRSAIFWLAACTLMFACVRAGAQEVSPSWYVANTEAGEWLGFKRVYLSAGHYRFTGHLGAARRGGVQLYVRPLDSNSGAAIALPGVVVEKTGAVDCFQLVHLGAQRLAAGHYDVRLIFNGQALSADFIHIRKSDATEARVLADDMHAPKPVHEGTHITPIGPSQAVNGGWTLGKYSEAQCLEWYKQPAYIDLNYEDSLHVAIEEAIAARVDWCWLHGRASMTKPNWDYGIDREEIPNPGNLSSYRLKRFFEILDRTPMAEHLQYSYFCDNVYFGKFFESKHGGKEARWDDPEFQQFIWDKWLRAWYLNVPRHRHKLADGDRVFLYFWTAECGVKGLENSYPFFIDLKRRLKEEFNLGVHFVLPTRFIRKDSRLADINYAHPPWFYWTQEQNVTFETFESRTLAFATNGRRLPVASVWELDWNPKEKKGTRVNAKKTPVDGYLRPVRQASATMTDYELGILDARQRGAEWLVLESWGNVFENSIWCRSDHPQFRYPNESISITRKYADEATASLMLQAEAFDECHDLTRGNAGGTYRYNWHAQEEVAADIYRPKRQIGAWQDSPLDQSVHQISAGTHDIWCVAKSGVLWACEIDGNARWKKVGKQKKLSRLALGSHIAWGIDEDGKVWRAGMPQGWPYPNSNNWTEVEHDYRFVDVAVNPQGRRPVLLDERGRVWFWKGDAWKGQLAAFVGSPTARDLAIGDHFLWAILENGSLAATKADFTTPWYGFKANARFEKIDIGNNELWALTEGGKLYRTREGAGEYLEFIESGVRTFSVGVGYVWLALQDGSLKFTELTDFAHGELSEAIPFEMGGRID